jgi:hypothetical protein
MILFNSVEWDGNMPVEVKWGSRGLCDDAISEFIYSNWGKSQESHTRWLRRYLPNISLECYGSTSLLGDSMEVSALLPLSNVQIQVKPNLHYVKA